MKYQMLTPPETEPVTLAEAKAHLRVSGTLEDSLIQNLIVAARQFCENHTNRLLMLQTWDLFLDGWPSAPRKGKSFNWEDTRDGAIGEYYEVAKSIDITMGPVQAIIAFDTIDDEGTATEFDDYILDKASIPARVALTSTGQWPSAPRRPINGIRIRFDAGYDSAALVPGPIKQAMLLLIAHWFENREAGVTGSISSETKIGVSTLLGQFRQVKI